MVARGVGSFASGLGQGLNFGMDVQNRRAEAEARARGVDAWATGAPLGAGHNTPGANALPGPAGAPAMATSNSDLFGLIDATEGGGRYDTLFGFSTREGPFAGVDVSQMTIGEAIEFSRPDGAYGQWVKDQIGRVATPMGRHQIVGTTLRNTVQNMGLPLDTPFNANTQDMIANYLASQRINSASTTQGQMAALRNEWEGFRHVSDADLAVAIRNFNSGT
jgi:hypothetical protein